MMFTLHDIFLPETGSAFIDEWTQLMPESIPLVDIILQFGSQAFDVLSPDKWMIRTSRGALSVPERRW
jgi:hypothetical protein